MEKDHLSPLPALAYLLTICFFGGCFDGLPGHRGYIKIIYHIIMIIYSILIGGASRASLVIEVMADQIMTIVTMIMLMKMRINKGRLESLQLCFFGGCFEGLPGQGGYG